MAAIESNTKSSLHTRCNSFPSAPHPLNRLKSSESASSSSSSMSDKLSGLQDFHDCTDKLLQLSIAKQALTRECSDELLDGSLRLLDIISIAKDFLSQSNGSVNEIQSIIRRRRVADFGFTIEATKYLASRKMMKKAIQKALGSLRGMRNESMNKVNDMLSMLKEAEPVTVSILQSLMCFISDPMGKSKQGMMFSNLKDDAA